MDTRRRCLRLAAALLPFALAPAARALQKRSLADPLRVAVDDALFDSGLAPKLQRAFAHDTGVALLLLPGPATAVLQALERGERDAALSNAPAIESLLEQQGLAHDRRPVAVSDFVLVGPPALAGALGPGRGLADALAHLALAQSPFLHRDDGSGTHLVEQAAWRAAKVAPGGPWYLPAAAKSPLPAQAAQRQACTIVERGVWAAHPARGLAVLAEGGLAFATPVHVLRSFRAEHPAGRLFGAWVAGPKGRARVASHRGYRTAVPLKTG